MATLYITRRKRDRRRKQLCYMRLRWQRCVNPVESADNDLYHALCLLVLSCNFTTEEGMRPWLFAHRVRVLLINIKHSIREAQAATTANEIGRMHIKDIVRTKTQVYVNYHTFFKLSGSQLPSWFLTAFSSCRGFHFMHLRRQRWTACVAEGCGGVRCSLDCSRDISCTICSSAKPNDTPCCALSRSTALG